MKLSLLRGPAAPAMQKLTVLFWTSLLLAPPALANGSSTLPRGVAPAFAQYYAPSADGKDTWRCLGSGKEIPYSAVNDDYCDCSDGSDEPGTSACPNSRFYCTNEGHIPAYIRSNRVNDGICDPECCDGSDEYDGKVVCPNVCAKVGKEYRKKMAEIENTRRAGAKIRAKYIVDGKKEADALEAEIAKLEVELTVAEEKEARLKSALDLAETTDRTIIEQKKASPLYATLQSHQAALKALHERNVVLSSELQTLTALLDDLARGYNPNYQDMAVKGAVVAYREWRRAGQPAPAHAEAAGEDGDADQTAEGDEEPVRLKELLEEGGWDAKTVRDMADRDPLDLMEGVNGTTSLGEGETGILFRIHEYLPDTLVPYFEALVDTILDLLLKANVITDVKRSKRAAAEEGEPENVTAARTAHNAASHHLLSVRSQIGQKRDALAALPERFGREGEFKALDGKCVERSMGEYTYEYCFFGRTMQKPQRGPHISLGKFERWDPENKSSPSEDAFYMRQLYDNGQKCWNGPQRSTLVDFVCDTTNALLDVFEAEKCIYSMKVSTPAVCFSPSAAQQAGVAGEASPAAAAKDEL